MELNRRTIVAGAGLAIAGRAFAVAKRTVDLGLPGGPSIRSLDPRFPQKDDMIVQRLRPPLLETPFDVFDHGVFTPNERHFVRWHHSDIPTSIDVTGYRVAIHGAVKSPRSLSLGEVLKAGEHVEFAAVNQCAGNGRGLFEPRVAGAQWANGAMSNAKWRGVRLRDLLDKAGVSADAKFVRVKGLDNPLAEEAPHFAKSIPIDVARRNDTIVAFAMNGQAMPLLNGFPIRLIVPGWFSTYWVKMLSDVEVLTAQDDNFWMATAYRIPTVAVKPGDKVFPTVPITTMLPRSFITSHVDGATIKAGERLAIRGIAMGGDAGVAKVEIVGLDKLVSVILEPEEGRFSFRRWSATVLVGHESIMTLGTRCTNTNGVTQPDIQPWNPSGYARNVVEQLALRVA